MNSTVATIVSKFDQARKEFEAEARVALKEGLQEFFANNPEVKAVTWTQYTPYFNDGETCEFGVHEPYFLPNRDLLPEDVLKQLGDEEEVANYDYCLYEAIRCATQECSWIPNHTYRPITAREKDLMSAMADVINMIESLGDVLKDVFGDHARVTATVNGFEVDSYDHD